MADTPILLLSSDPARVQTVRGPLEQVGYRIDLAETIDAAIGALVGHAILLIAEPYDATAAAACARVRATPSLRGLAICVLTPSNDVEARVAMIQAGADEVVPEAIDPRELDARINALLLRSTRAIALAGAAAESAAARRPRRSIAVFSPSGGVGTTTIAVNVAVALAAHHPGRVAVADMHLPFGQVATHLDIRPHRTITDLGHDDVAITDPSLIATYAERHASGLAVYAAPGTWDPASTMTPEMAVAFIETATLAHDRIVLDLGSAVDERTVAALARADAVLLPVRPEIAALRALHSFADALADHQVDLAKTAFVLNDLTGRESLRPKDVETALGRAPMAELPHDPLVYVRAVNEGVPLVTGSPESAPAHALVRLASAITGDPGHGSDGRQPASTEKKQPSRFGAIFGGRG
jgi:pilus assembly protein CpaE